MKIKINQRFLKEELRKNKISYSELEQITQININRWKHILNNGGYVNDKEITQLTEIIGCNPELIIDFDFQIHQNTPLEIDLLIRNLYKKRIGNIQPIYESIIRDFQKNGKLESFIGEANWLLTSLFADDQLDVNSASALSLIINDFQKERIFSGSRAELPEQTISDIFKVAHNSIRENSAQQSLVIFLYTLVLFDVIFLEESIASVTQFTKERFGEKADQYCLLTFKTEILRETLINHMIVGDLKMTNDSIDDITEEILEGVHLILLACYKVGQHLNSNHFSSEYVDRAELDAIITKLTRILKNLGIKVPDAYSGTSGTRFYKYLSIFRCIYLSNRSYSLKFTNHDYYVMGLLYGSQLKN